ncbi:Protein disulfide oxidoreductase [Sulfobacillus acidophilus TPY]|nr:Protein disulfide oxidoreductase [Sulfobacillus acidophilus TPY]
MNIISDNIRQEVSQFLADMKQPVTMEFYAHPSNPATDPMRQLLNELHDINPKVEVVEHSMLLPPVPPETPEDLEGPITIFSVNGQSTGIRYLGFPGGQEFGTFLEDIVDLSVERPVSLSEATQDWLRGLTTPLHLEVFVTPT